MSITALVFLIGYLFFLGAAIFRHPIFGLYGYMLVLYTDPPQAWWGHVLPSIPWSFLISIVVLAVLCFRKDFEVFNSIKRSKLFWLFFSFWLWMILQIAWAIDAVVQREGVELIFKYIILFCMMATLCDTPEKIKKVLTVCILGSAYIGYQGVISGGGGRMEGVGGAGFRDANTVGMYLASLMFASGFILLHSKGWWRIAILLSIPLIANAIILAGSRGSFLSLAASALVAIYFKPHQIKKLFYLGMSVAAIGFSYLASDFLIERLGTLTAIGSDEEELESSAASRLDILAHQYEMFKSKPIIGHGYKATVQLSIFYMPPELMSETGRRSSHNTLAAVAVSHGGIGLVLYLMIYFTAALQLLYLRKRARKRDDFDLGIAVSALACGIVVVCFGGLFSNYFKAEVFVWFLAMISALHLAETKRQNREESGEEDAEGRGEVEQVKPV